MHDEYLKNLVGDIMGGLMVIFLFISVIFMSHQGSLTKQAEQQRQVAEQQKEQMQKIAFFAEQYRVRLNVALHKEFDADIIAWQAVIYPDNRIIFSAPDVLFANDKKKLSEYYKGILRDFFPRYVDVLYAHKARIELVHIEGHASTPGKTKDMDDNYIYNMKLSQQRAFNALEYGYKQLYKPKQKEWLRGVLAAPGYSSGRIVSYADGRENKTRSRRVEFRVWSKAEQSLTEILKVAQGLDTINLKEK